jgi:hypothetical protein
MAVTTFHHKGKTVRRTRVEPRREFVCAFDIGQAIDNTTIAVLEYQLRGTGEFTVTEGQNGITLVNEKHDELFDLRELQRIKLQTSYDDICAHIDRLMNTEPLVGADLAFDSTAAGRVFGDMLESSTRLKPLRITTTAGLESVKVDERAYHVPKQELVSCLSVLFATAAAPAVSRHASLKR